MFVFGNKYRIRKHDNYNLVVEKYNKVIRRDTKLVDYEWQIWGYHSTLPQALRGLKDLALYDGVELTDNFDDFVDYVSKYTVGVEIKDEIKED